MADVTKMLFGSTIAVMSIERVEFVSRIIPSSEISDENRSTKHTLGAVYETALMPDGTIVAYAAIGSVNYHSKLMEHVTGLPVRSSLLPEEFRYQTVDCLSYLPLEQDRIDPARVIAVARGRRPESDESERVAKKRLWYFCAGLWHATTLAMAQDLAPRFTVTPDMAEAIQRPDLPPLADAYTESASWQ